MQRPKLALFDLDGTVLDTLQDLADSMNAVLRVYGMPVHTIEEIRWFVGNGIPKLVTRAVPEGTDEATRDQVLAAFHTYYKAHCADRTAPYAGVNEMLAALRAAGVQTALVSNKADFAVQALREQFFPDVFDAAMGDHEGMRRKPAPDMVDAVLAQLGVSREEAVYIGDSDVDIETAKNAGMPCISVTWGFRPADFLTAHGAATLVDTPAQLLDILLGSSANVN